MARTVGPSDPSGQRPQVVLGAVTTGLLNTSEPLPLEAARQALALLPGVSADWHRHPIEQVVSPDVFFGLDCRLAVPPGSGSQPRVIGTARARAVLTAGHILQGSARVEVLLDANRRRLPWAHYAARTGVVEAINKADPADLVTGFLRGAVDSTLLDLGKTGAYVMSLLDRAPQIDRRARLKTETGRLLWAVHVQDGVEPDSLVELRDDGMLRVRIGTPAELLPQFVEFCEILALHHWLLSALRNAFDRSTRSRRRRPEDELDPALSYLGHVWNPGAHLPHEMRGLWQRLENEAQLTWEWESTLTRVRDKVSLLTRKAIEETLHKEVV
ncbi:SCO2521 family protein [Catenulispora pinisilvae]|uniref:SCO2521 family protein n=1 Tax=Catenulispora pinisilvae TaxID=2705253 RepID=UPI0018917A65|nr:SCO2521 family protein [Catenulispora pinisilvae]